MEEGCCVSAPGKVLVAGGYLVTLRPHPGLVFSVSARLYAAVGPAAAPASSPATLNGGADQNEFGLVVDSPQFRKTFRFSAALAAADGSSEPHLLLRNSYVIIISYKPFPFYFYLCILFICLFIYLLVFVCRSGEANEFIETTLVSALTAGVGLLGVDSFRVCLRSFTWSQQRRVRCVRATGECDRSLLCFWCRRGWARA
jgi:hypothetical protein